MAEMTLPGAAQQSVARPDGGYAWYVAGVLALAYLLSILDRSLLSVVLEPLKARFQLTDTQLGVLQGPSFVLLFLFASIPCGRLADAWNRRLLLACGLTIWSLATAATAFAQNFQQLLGARLLVGAGEAALLPGGMSLIAAYFSKAKLSRAVAVFSSGGTLGQAMAFGGGGALLAWLTARGADTYGAEPWQVLFLVAGVAGLATALLILVSIKEPPRTFAPVREGAVRAALAHFRQQGWGYAGIFLPFGLSCGISAQMLAWSVSFYVRGHGLPTDQAAGIVGAVGLFCGVPGYMLGGWVNDRLRRFGHGHHHPLVMAVCIPIALVCITAFALTSSLAVSVAAFGLAYGLLCVGVPTAMSGVQILTPDAHRGLISALFLICYTALGIGLGPFLVGLIGDYVVRDPENLGQAMLISGWLMAAGAVTFAVSFRSAFARSAHAEDVRAGG